VTTAYVQGPSAADWPFLERELALDPITFEILRHKLESINEEQAIALKAVSSSPIVTEASDFNNALYTAGGEIASMGPQVVFHSGAMPIVLRHVMEDCAENPGIGEGDMFVVNDPYKGAVHHPDVSLVAPIHYESELVAWAGVAAHQVDVGGMTVGSISVRAREKQQEGLMLPPTKLVEAGVMREDVWRLILNMTRQPQMVGLDLKGFVASNFVARRRLVELIGEYGLDTVVTVMDELIRYSERRLRERLLELPDGEFRAQGFLDHDAVENRLYVTDLVLTKEEDVLRFDFSASSPQAPGFINCTEAGLIGAVFGGAAPLLAFDIPWNQGILKPLEVIAPPGLVLNAVEPAPTGSGTIAQAWMTLNTTVQAVSKLLAFSDRYRSHSSAVTNGTFDALFLGDRNQHGEGWGTQLMDAQLGGGGASAVADGIDQSGGYVTPRPNIPNVETNEMHGPMLYLYRSFFPDSGGDGAFRGGRAAGVAWTPYFVERVRCALTTQGIEVPVSPGLFGGYPGVCNRHTLVRGSDAIDLIARGELPLVLDSVARPIDLGALGGEVFELPAKVDEFELRPGDVLQYTWAGGGGYGDPAARDPALVARDLELRVISREKAERVYGAPRGGSAVGLRLARGRLECECGHVFGSARENWKDGAVSRPCHPLPPGIRLHDDLELVEWRCPACARLQWVDVKLKDTAPIQDFQFA
jgi:N-methylhydantoinase B